MNPLAIVALATVVAASLIWLARRRAASRRAACRLQLAAVLAERRPHLRLAETESGRWRLERDGSALAVLEPPRLTRAVAGTPGSRTRLFLAVADAAEHGPRPLADRFDLKLHGPRILPRLADEGLPMLSLPAAVRFAAPDAAGLATTYLVDGEPRPAYLTEEHLAAAGIDARDLHGVALAVLRQRFDETAARAALTADGAIAIEPDDGCGASRLLLLPEALAGGETLFAAVPSPRLLLLAAGRGRLAAALTARPAPAEPLPPAVFRVTAAGLTRYPIRES